jgi:hypothetical protein
MHKSWFRKSASEFTTRFDDFKGKPITYVEIGVWDGASAVWVCENVLTHKQSRGIGIDPYEAVGRRKQDNMDDVRASAAKHLSPFPNWQWMIEDSKSALRTWLEPIDILYIDGLHQAHLAMQDFVLAFPFLTEGALVIFDDYGIGRRKYTPCVPETVAAVLMAFQGHVIPLEGNDRQYAMRVCNTTGGSKRGGQVGLEAWSREMKGVDREMDWVLGSILKSEERYKNRHLPRVEETANETSI